jgi:hypothetical protein
MAGGWLHALGDGAGLIWHGVSFFLVLLGYRLARSSSSDGLYLASSTDAHDLLW